MAAIPHVAILPKGLLMPMTKFKLSAYYLHTLLPSWLLYAVYFLSILFLLTSLIQQTSNEHFLYMKHRARY